MYTTMHMLYHNYHRSGGVMSMGNNGRLQTGLRSEGGSVVPRYTYLDLHIAPDDRNDT